MMNEKRKQRYVEILKTLIESKGSKYENSNMGLTENISIMNSLIYHLEMLTKEVYAELKDESERVQRFKDLENLTYGLSKEEILMALKLK